MSDWVLFLLSALIASLKSHLLKDHRYATGKTLVENHASLHPPGGYGQHGDINIAFRYGADGGGTRRLVACSNAYASSIRRGSLQAIPVKPTPKGVGFAAKPSGNGWAGAVGEFGTSPNGTITVG